MIDIRPHTIVLHSDGEGHYDASGDWIAGGSVASEPVPCRYEDNGKAETIRLDDGSDYRYTYVVYLDVDCPDYRKGQTVELFGGRGGSLGRFTVQGFHRRQLHSVLWV